MTTPPLFVVYIPGWVKPNAGFASILDIYPTFLEDIVSSFPSITISCDSSLAMSEVHTILGTGLAIPSPQRSVSSLLSSHGIKQIRVSDADRYGLLTSSANGGNETAFPGEDWHYLTFPSLPSMSDDPETTNKQLAKFLAPYLKKSLSSTVVTLSINNMWSCAVYKNKSILYKSVLSAQKLIQSLVQKLQNTPSRILLIGDGPLVITNKTDINYELPCVFIDPRLEGVRGSQMDTVVDWHLPAKSDGTIFDVTPTILKLMEVYIPDDLPGKPLFGDLIPRTL